MTDHIDDMFARDLEKLSMPSQLALNAQKVKAAQDPKKKGAEKPDLGAPGKKKAAMDKEAMCGEDHSKLGKGKKCPKCGKGEHKMPDGKIMKDSEHEKKALMGVDDIVGAAVGHHYGKKQKERGEKHTFGGQQVAGTLLAPGGAGYQVGRYIAHLKDKKKKEKKASLDKEAVNAPGAMQTVPKKVRLSGKGKAGLAAAGLLATGLAAKALTGKKEESKEASADELDENFAADLHQIVGIDVPEARPDFERPDIKVADQATDLIDDHYLAWMEAKSADDVVVVEPQAKEAGAKEVLKRLVQPAARHVRKAESVPGAGREGVAKMLAESEMAGAAKGALGTAAVGTGGAGLYAAGKKKGEDEERKDTAQERRAYHRGRKTAAVNEDPENLDLMARLRRRAAAGLGGTVDA